HIGPWQAFIQRKPCAEAKQHGNAMLRLLARPVARSAHGGLEGQGSAAVCSRSRIGPAGALSFKEELRVTWRINVFGVRHLSPTGAWHLCQFLGRVQPKAVLIEGLTDADE